MKEKRIAYGFYKINSRHMQYGYTTINLRNMCHIFVNVFLKLEEVRVWKNFHKSSHFTWALIDAPILKSIFEYAPSW